MMRQSGITISKGSLDYVLHNVRVKQTNNSIFDNTNIYMNSYEEALDLYKQELEKRVKAYVERTGKKLQKRTFTHLTAIVTLDEHNANKKYMQKLVKFLEDRYDTKVFNWAIHLDEGWIDEEGNKHINYHAHIEMMGIDSDGASIRRKLDRVELRNLQTEVAKILDMPRGTVGSKKKRLSTYTYKKVAKEHYQQLQKLKQDREEQIEYERKLRRKAEEKAKRLEEENKKLKEQSEQKFDIQEKQKNRRTDYDTLKKELETLLQAIAEAHPNPYDLPISTIAWNIATEIVDTIEQKEKQGIKHKKNPFIDF